MRCLNFITVTAICFCFFSDLNAQQIINESFDKGLIPLEGWEIKADGIYSTTSGSGLKPPSLKFSQTNQFIETREFANANSLSFWYKGYTTDSISSLIVDYKEDTTWYRLDSICPIERSERIFKSSLPDFTSKIRITFKKSSGKVAIDDIIIEKISDSLYFTEGTPSIVSVSNCGAKFSFTSNKNAVLHYLLCKSYTVVPSVDQIINGAFENAEVVASDSIQLTEGQVSFARIDSLSSETGYTLFSVMKVLNKSKVTFSYIDSLTFHTRKHLNTCFFSEIVKGTGYNRAIEIYNPNKDTIWLNNYRIGMSTNGDGWKSSYFYFQNNAYILPHSVFVILKSKADSNLVNFSVANEVTSSSVLTFTGNDARSLEYSDDFGMSWKIADVYGNPYLSDVFDVAGLKNAASKYNLSRKGYIYHGNENWNISKGNDSISSEWLLLPISDYTNLGKFNLAISECGFKEVSFFGEEEPAIIDRNNFLIKVKLHSSVDTTDVKWNYLIESGNIIKDSSIFKTLDLSRHDTIVIYNSLTGDSSIWRIIYEKDLPPSIEKIFYFPDSISLSFSEKIDMDLLNIHLFKIKSLKENIKINDFDVFTTDSLNFTIIFENKLVDGEKYIVAIDSVFDSYHNQMPSFQDEFIVKIGETNDVNSTKINFNVWPNPAKNYLFISSTNEIKNIQIFDVSGKKYLTEIIYTNKQVQIDISKLSASIYFVKIQNVGNSQFNTCFVKSR